MHTSTHQNLLVSIPELATIQLFYLIPLGACSSPKAFIPTYMYVDKYLILGVQ